jgi:DNA-binding SARP family transcriptional activator
MDARRGEEAMETLSRRRQNATDASALQYELLARVEEARLRLRLDRDAASAIAALDPVDRHANSNRIGRLGGIVDCWYGFALLLQGRDAEALERLRRSVAVYRRTGFMLEAPAAAVYLAEAEWRMGNEEAADGAADLALAAARAQGFNHMLLLALRDFPAVLSRRLDAEPWSDSAWHEVGRALRAQGVRAQASVRASVQLVEFGRLAIEVEGREMRPRIAKTYELFAYLLTRPERRAERDELLDVLFDGRADDSARAYLRQAVRWLRATLPRDGLISDRAGVALGQHVTAISESVKLEHALAQAARLRGDERLAATLAALETVGQGEYLPGICSRWVEDRRQELRELATDARYEAAELAFAEGRLLKAERLTETILEAEPFHEAAWRLTMRLASARGDNQGVLRSYQRCDRVLAELGAGPSASTRHLMDQLRR